ncbi:MAG TPA: hypothetical protein VFG10_03965 [Saprospiraceae bacterium]|nr:hypothetical protein [Saprospiraceae bacterium]
MEENQNKSGRTFSDLVAEHPLRILTGALFILIFAALLIWLISILNYKVKVSNIEISPQNSTLIDTHRIQTDAIKLTPTSKPTLSRVDFITTIPKSKHENEQAKVPNSPYIINTGINTGIMGSNNEVQVNLGKPARELDQIHKKDLLNLLGRYLNAFPVRDSCVQISSVFGNDDASTLAREVRSFLEQNKFKLGIITASLTDPPLIGTEVSYDTVQHCIIINIGFPELQGSNH